VSKDDRRARTAPSHQADTLARPLVRVDPRQRDHEPAAIHRFTGTTASRSSKKQLQGEVVDAQLQFVDGSGRYWIRTDMGMLLDEKYRKVPRTLRRRPSLRSRRG